MTLTVAPLTTAVMQAVSPSAAGVASGVNNTVAGVAGLLAIASFGMVMSSTFNGELRRDISAANLPPAAAEAVEAQRAKLAAIEPPPGASAGVRTAIRHSVAQAFVSGFRRVMLIAAGLALASAASAWLMIGGDAPPRRPP
jgi:hypothetical protein